MMMIKHTLLRVGHEGVAADRVVSTTSQSRRRRGNGVFELLVEAVLGYLLRWVDFVDVEVSTVDGFQGREANVVLVSATRANAMRELGFVHDPRRLCVALTRARRALVIVGDASTLRANQHWAALLDWCALRDCLLDEADVLAALDGAGEVRCDREDDWGGLTDFASSVAEPEGIHLDLFNKLA